MTFYRDTKYVFGLRTIWDGINLSLVFTSLNTVIVGSENIVKRSLSLYVYKRATQTQHGMTRHSGMLCRVTMPNSMPKHGTTKT